MNDLMALIFMFLVFFVVVVCLFGVIMTSVSSKPPPLLVAVQVLRRSNYEILRGENPSTFNSVQSHFVSFGF